MEKILNYVKLNKKMGQMLALHMCFTGNSGTGKTSIARDLVDKYVGWTAQKVHNMVEEAIGGVLFIDETYSLIADKRGSFEDEAIAQH